MVSPDETTLVIAEILEAALQSANEEIQELFDEDDSFTNMVQMIKHIVQHSPEIGTKFKIAPDEMARVYMLISMDLYITFAFDGNVDLAIAEFKQESVKTVEMLHKIAKTFESHED